MNRNDDEALARNRFLLLNLVRLSGLAMVLVALAIYFGRIDLPVVAAYVLGAVGIADYFFLPKLLAKRWRTPDR